MHKTISMSLQGVSYPIEEAAYDRLDRYLAHVRRSFSNPVEAEEVTSDIEARMAERLAERVEPGQNVTLDQAEWLIAAIGDPSDVDSDDGPSVAGAREDGVGRGPLLRSPDNRMIAGVCGGLAAYFSVDVVWVRIAFVLTVALGLTVAGPLSLLAYLSMSAMVGYVGLWLFLPVSPATISTAHAVGHEGADTLARQLGRHESLRTVPAAILRSSREGAPRFAGSVHEPLSSLADAIRRRGRQAAIVGRNVSSLFIGTVWRAMATALGIALLAIALVGIATEAVAGISPSLPTTSRRSLASTGTTSRLSAPNTP